ncbi:glycoside hydrolase family 92 protein [Tilletiaria anomala UBC 951]|uniref:Glycoside hydrolase family 92 protein n=1 Tax=Tilletiaria anomala (strain ATCC 24038 / CBS 436.72 / UBC 951) TaxID=1037660 RepID=A0A066VAS3_TILAU|nr:glycoside hydrolase family 92 protein [Tilletiaria anomala UBC 951]KDN37378.1 glycoside hydrolase family 92 protein [Tilletiaria anomala UBC 951]
MTRICPKTAPKGAEARFRVPNFTRSLEYTTNDSALVSVAGGLHNAGDHENYLRRSANWRNIFNPNLHTLGYSCFAWPRNASGKLVPYWSDYAYKATLWGVQNRKLDNTFEKGRVNIGNEPSFLASFTYNYNVSQNHTSNVNGHPGKTDASVLPAELLWQFLGLYPYVPSPIYLIVAPHTSEMRVYLTRADYGAPLQLVKTLCLTKTSSRPPPPNSLTNGTAFGSMAAIMNTR